MNNILNRLDIKAIFEATYMGVGGSIGSFGGGSGICGTGRAVADTKPKKPRKRLAVITRVTEGNKKMSLLTLKPSSLARKIDEIKIVKEKKADETKKVEEAALYVNKSDIPKINGLFQQKFNARFGFPAVYKHDIDNRMIINGLPAEKLPEIIEFYKSYGCDVQLASAL